MKRFCKYLILLILASVASTLVFGSAYFEASSAPEWRALLEPAADANYIVPAPEVLWLEFEDQRGAHLQDGDPVPDTIFLPPDLYVFEGDEGNPEYPDEPGLIMSWGEEGMDEGSYSSAYEFVYGTDPDLTNSTITLSVHPPATIIMVSFALKDINGAQCSWTWYVPANIASSPPGPPTTITINTNDIPSLGVNSSVPACSAFSYNPGFDMTQVVSLLIGETFHNTPGINPPPPPGQTLNFYWNAWDSVSIQQNSPPPSVYKGYYVKYSQKPKELEPGMIYGWDQASQYYYNPDGNAVMFMAADDWVCSDPRPVTDLHWWGSFKGWTGNVPPAIVPDYFMICIWKDIPAEPPDMPYSHPLRLLWAHKCYKWVWNYAGVDVDPKCEYDPGVIDPDYYSKIGGYRLDFPPCEREESCFQFNQLLSEDEYFRQEEGTNIYWVSIAAVYENYSDPRQIPHPWGWKTKPYDPDKAPDIAVIINDIDQWPLTPGVTNVTGFKPIILPNVDVGKEPFDLTFELTTNQKKPGTCYDIDGDINHDCVVNVDDFRIVARDWLQVSIP